MKELLAQRRSLRPGNSRTGKRVGLGKIGWITNPSAMLGILSRILGYGKRCRGFGSMEILANQSTRSADRCGTVSGLPEYRLGMNAQTALSTRKRVLMSNRTNLERQLTQADAALAAQVQVLEAKGIAADGLKRDPHWRQLNSKRRQILNRLSAVASVEEREAEAARRKAGEGAAD